MSIQTTIDIELERLEIIKKYLDKGYIDSEQYQNSYIRISSKIGRYTNLLEAFKQIMNQSIDKSVSNESDLSEKSK